MTYQVAVVGTGDPAQPDRYAMAYRHARGYARLDECELVACGDIVEENARAFAKTFEIDPANAYQNYEQLLTELEPDIVSVCTPPTVHAEIVEGCARSGVVDAIHCEKPMADTWQACKEMVGTCEEHDVQLTFNHQRRFAEPYQRAKSLLAAGEIGDLRRIEIGGSDLYDYGTHLFDMCGYLTDQTPVEWVIGQIDCRDASEAYGLYQENQALARWRYESGVDGLAATGTAGAIDCEIRLVGERGVVEIGHSDGPPLRMRTDDAGEQTVDTGRDGVWRLQTHPADRLLERISIGPDRFFSEPTYVERAIEDVVTAFRDGETSTLAAENALQTTELIFACWESARRGGRVDLPLQIEDNPLEELVTTARAEPQRS